MSDILEAIKNYYQKRGLVWPDFDSAMKFVATEIGEVYEVDLARKTWVRNHPENKPKFSKERLAEELGDVIFMLLVAGIVEDIDPFQAMLSKMEKKLEKDSPDNSINVLSGVSDLYIMSDSEIAELNRKIRDTSPTAFYEET